MPRRNSPRSENLRRALAQEAARVMAQHGIHDFRTAKRKAADRFGITDEQRAAAQHRDRSLAGRLSAPVRRRRARRHLAGPAARRAARHAHAVRVQPAPGRAGAVAAPRPRTPTCSCICSRTTPRTWRSACSTAASPRDHRAPRAARCRAHQELPVGALRARRAPHRGHRVSVDGIRQTPVSPVDGRPMRRADVSELEALLSTPMLRRPERGQA